MWQLTSLSASKLKTDQELVDNLLNIIYIHYYQSFPSSSMAASQFCMRISEASFPHKELKAFLSVEGTWEERGEIMVE